MQDRYHPESIEKKWQERWEKAGAFTVQEATKDKFYVLEMLPYPSGRIHMGHVRNYTIGDVMARHARMRGKTVLHPMGWDAFGMPAENAAMERGRHPREWTYDNIAQMRRQLKRLGLSYDWNREFATCDPDYYRHEQEIFIRMLERGLVYRKHALANWCGQCATVLANEQVEEGRCWRCGSEVVQRAMPQWFVRITRYAEELLQGIETLRGGWSEDVLSMQRNWIGKSTGAEIRFALSEPVEGEGELRVFTTRPDTLFGVTFMSLAAEHPLALALARGTGRQSEVQAFVERIRAEHKVKRAGEEEDKQGIFTGRTCRHPLTGAEIPIWIANFVLIDYGTGAVMAVPAHDQRDFDFARKYGLAVRVVIQPEGERLDGAAMAQAYEGDGLMDHSGPFDGTPNREAMAKVIAKLSDEHKGGAAVSYRLRDWLVSRQRYWGAPIPVVHCPKDGVVPVPVHELPVVLPPDVTFTGAGGSPLARHSAFMRATCPKCGSPAERESDTLDTFVESSWYFLRYTSPRYPSGPVDPAVARAWMPVDLYIGGKEHAVMHLLYARFWQRMMIDLGYLPPDTSREPFTRLLNQGMVCREFYSRNDPDNPSHKIYYYPEQTEIGDKGARVLSVTERKQNGGIVYVVEGGDTVEVVDGPNVSVDVGGVVKMSKTKKNTVEPDQIMNKYGVDTARLFILFAAPPEGQLDWNDAAVEGAQRFLQRVWRLVSERHEALVKASPYKTGALEQPAADLRRVIHRTIQRVTYDLSERSQPNTAIAAQMELVNAIMAFEPRSDADWSVTREGVDTLLHLLSPFAPHIADELYETLGGQGLLIERSWPLLDEAALQESTVEIPVQINGKVRGRVRVAPGANEEAAVTAAKADPQIAERLKNTQIKKTVYVPGRILTFVVVDVRTINNEVKIGKELLNPSPQPSPSRGEGEESD